MKEPYQGPYKNYKKVNDNGTICLQTGAVEELINLQKLMPYFPANAPNHGGGRGNAVCHIREMANRTNIVPRGPN